MILTEEQMEELYSPARNGIISTKYRWPHRIVPYRLSRQHTKKQRHYIELALRKIESVSCLRFYRQRNEKHYIKITVSWRIAIISKCFWFSLRCKCELGCCRPKIVDVIQQLDTQDGFRLWIYTVIESNVGASNLAQSYMNFCMVRLFIDSMEYRYSKFDKYKERFKSIFL